MPEDRRTNDITRAAGDAFDNFKARNQWHPIMNDGIGEVLLNEVHVALKIAATEAYQRGAGWGLQQHHATTVNINCPHTEAMP